MDHPRRPTLERGRAVACPCGSLVARVGAPRGERARHRHEARRARDGLQRTRRRRRYGLGPGRGSVAAPQEDGVASGWFVGPQAANARDAGLPSARLSAFREAAAELAGVGWAAVCWGTLGQAKPERCWHIDLPSGTRAAERAVEEGIAAAVNAALTYVRRAALARDGGPTRKRLDHHPRQLAVYLLHHGHGQLKRRGWRRTAMVLFNDETTPKTGLWVESKQARALRRDHTAACRRIGIAASSAGSVSVKAR